MRLKYSCNETAYAVFFNFSNVVLKAEEKKREKGKDVQRARSTVAIMVVSQRLIQSGLV